MKPEFNIIGSIPAERIADFKRSHPGRVVIPGLFFAGTEDQHTGKTQTDEIFHRSLYKLQK
jgi:hypothetical protein